MVEGTLQGSRGEGEWRRVEWMWVWRRKKSRRKGRSSWLVCVSLWEGREGWVMLDLAGGVDRPFGSKGAVEKGRRKRRKRQRESKREEEDVLKKEREERREERKREERRLFVFVFMFVCGWYLSSYRSYEEYVPE